LFYCTETALDVLFVEDNKIISWIVDTIMYLINIQLCSSLAYNYVAH
jgi:hypothetical protein